jgi:hypothetical protein
MSNRNLSIYSGWLLREPAVNSTGNNNCNLRDEVADTGDQPNAPMDLGRQMGFDGCGKTFIFEALYDAKSSYR